MQAHRDRELAERLDRLLERDAFAVHLDAARAEEIRDVLRSDRAEQLAFLGGLPALLVGECLDARAQAVGVGLHPIGLRLLLLLDVLEVLEVAGGRGQRQPLGDEVVPRIAIRDVAHFATASDLRDVVEQDDFHRLVRREVRQERHRSRLLDGVRQLALVTGTAAGDASRNDLAALTDEASETAHVLEVDEIDLVHTELADLPPSEPAALDGLLGCRGNGSLLPLVSRPYALERNIVVAGPWLLGERLGSRRNGRRGGRAAASHELDTLGDDLDDGSLAAVLGLPLTGLQPALDQDRTALVEVLATALRLLAPDHHGEEAGLFALLAPLRRVVAIDRQPQIGHGGPAGRVTKLRGLGQVADQEHLVEARHQLTSSSTSWVFAGRAFLRIGTRVLTKRSTFSLRRTCRSNSFTMEGSAETSKTAYVPSRCLRMSYASRRFPQLSTLVTSAPSVLSCSPSCSSSAATSSSVGRGSTITRTSYGRSVHSPPLSSIEQTELSA